MFESIFNFFRELDRRIKVLFAFIGISQWGRNLPLQYNQLYATALGASPIQLGTLNSVGSVANSLISIPSGWIADRYGIKKIILLALGLSCIVATIYGLADNWWILIPALLLQAPAWRINPFVDIFFINIVKPEQRGIIMSLSRTLWAIPSIFAPIVAAVIISHFGGLNERGIRPLYFLQLVLVIFVFISISYFLKESPNSTTKKTIEQKAKRRGFIQDFRDMFQGEAGVNCKKWIVVKTLRSFGTRISGPFVPLWLVMKGADPYILGLMGSVQMIMTMLFQIPAGKLSDKIGRKKAFYLFAPFRWLGLLLLVIAPSPEWLILVGILGGVLGSGEGGGLGGVSSIPFVTMEHELVPAEARGKWMGIMGFLGVFTFPLPILGGILWEQGLLLAVLLMPLFIDAVIAIPLFHTIPDTLKRHTLEITDD